MKEYNAIEAARILGISDKTVRRHIQKCTIQASRKASGELKIAEDQLDKLRIVLELESESRHEQTGLEDMPRQIEMLTTRVNDLESRLVYLESLQSQNKPFKITNDRLDVQPQQSPRNRNVGAKKGTLPDGCILCSDFAKQYGIPVRSMHDYLVLGIGRGTVPGELSDPMLPVKEQIDYSERPKPGRAREVERYFNLEQAAQAVEVLKRHGKI